MKDKTPVKEFQRELMGTKIIGGDGRCHLMVRGIYRISWENGSVSWDVGRDIQVMPGYEHMNGTAKQKEEAKRNLRPDLEPAMRAAKILLDGIERACWDLDAHYNPVMRRR